MSVAVRAGLQPRVYRDGMQYMKDRIKDIHDELNRVQCEYHQTEEVDQDRFVDYLKACNKHFLRANTELRKRSTTLEVIDSEVRLVSLLNQLRENSEFDPETINFLTQYWENIKSTMESLKAVVSKFQMNVLNRLKKNYISHDLLGDTRLDVFSSYTEDISSYLTETEDVLSNTQILIRSFHSGIHQELFDTSRFVDVILVTCDLKAFPVLRLVADVVLKVTRMCDVAHLWLARDEHFMQEINTSIREARHRTWKRQEDLK